MAEKRNASPFQIDLCDGAELFELFSDFFGGNLLRISNEQAVLASLLHLEIKFFSHVTKVLG